MSDAEKKDEMIVGPSAAGGGASGPPQGQQITIEDAGVSTQYANFFAISASPEEVVLDFGNTRRTEAARARVEARVVVSPANAKRLAMALGQTIKAYEDKYGVIEVRRREPAGN